MARQWNFKQIIRRTSIIKHKLPNKLAIIMKRHFQGSFRKQGFTDESLDPWKARKIKDSGRAILVKSSALKRSIRVRSASFSIIKVGSYGIPYSSRHNRGLKGMPQRQFIGPSKVMAKQIAKMIGKELKSMFK